MTPERYKRLTDWLEGHPALREGIILLNRWLPLVPFVCYPVLLVLLNLRWFRMLTIGRGGGALDFMQVIARAILVPGLAFGLGTILRARLNFPRPYEQPGSPGTRNSITRAPRLRLCATGSTTSCNISKSASA